MSRISTMATVFSTLLFSFPIFAQSESDSVEKTLLKLEQNWAKAIEKRDGKAMEPFLASDFISIEPDGSVLNKEQYIQARVKDPVDVESSVLEKVQVREFGSTARVTGLQTNHGSLKGKKTIERFRYVDIFILKNGAWQCISTQVTPLPAK